MRLPCCVGEPPLDQFARSWFVDAGRMMATMRGPVAVVNQGVASSSGLYSSSLRENTRSRQLVLMDEFRSVVMKSIV